MKYYIAVISLAIIFLSACATSTDPHEGGFLGGVQGLSSGEYDRRHDERQARLERMKQQQSQLDNESRSLTQDKSSLEKKLQAEKRNIRKLHNDSKSLDKQIAQLNSDNEIEKNKVDELKQRSSRLKRNINDTSNSLDALEGDDSGGSSVDKQREHLEAQRRELQNEYQLLLDMTLELGQ